MNSDLSISRRFRFRHAAFLLLVVAAGTGIVGLASRRAQPVTLASGSRSNRGRASDPAHDDPPARFGCRCFRTGGRVGGRGVIRWREAIDC